MRSLENKDQNNQQFNQNTGQMYPPPNQLPYNTPYPQKKKKNGCLRGCLITTVILFAISLLILIGVYAVIKTNINKKIEEQEAIENVENLAISKELDLLLLDDTPTHYEIVQTKPDGDFDQDGLSNLEEATYGTNPFRRDTSGNGISDYDAIYTYKLDPLLYSSSDDGISDGLKVLYDLNLNHQYTENETQDILSAMSFVEDDGLVTLSPNSLSSATFYQYDSYYDEILVKDKSLISEARHLKYFTGQVTIDIQSYTNVIKDYKKKQLQVLFYDVNNMTYIKADNVSIDNTTITFDNNPSYPFVLSYDSELTNPDKKVGFIRKTIDNALVKFSGNNTVPISGIKEVRIVIFQNLYFTPNMMYIIEEGGTTDSQEILVDEDNLFNTWQVTRNNTSKSGIFFIDKVMDIFFAEIVKDSSDQEVIDMFVVYKRFQGSDADIEAAMNEYLTSPISVDLTGDQSEDTVDDTLLDEASIIEEKIIEKENHYNAHSGFDLKRDAYAFKNLSTTYAPGGVCAGFAYTVMQYYCNADNYPRTDTYSMEDGTVLTADLTGPTFDSFYNRDVYGFLISDPVFGDYYYNNLSEESNAHSAILDTSKVQGPDYQLVRNLELNWWKANELRADVFEKYESDIYSFAIINELAHRFKNGEVFYISLCPIGDSGSHAITAYGLEVDPKNPNKLSLLVYDSNFPNNMLHNTDETGKITGLTDISNNLVFNLYRTYDRKLTFNGLEYIPSFDFQYGYQYNNGQWHENYYYGSVDKLHNRSPWEEKGLTIRSNFKDIVGADSEVFTFYGDTIVFYDKDMNLVTGEGYEVNIDSIDIQLLNTTVSPGETLPLTVYANLSDGMRINITEDQNCKLSVPITDYLYGYFDNNKNYYCEFSPLFDSDGKEIVITASYNGYKANTTITVSR